MLAERTRICDGRASGLRAPRSALFGRVIDAQEYASLASAADYHCEAVPSPLHAAAKLQVELDRCAAMAELGYRVRMGKLPPEAKSPKDDVLWGWVAPSGGGGGDGDGDGGGGGATSVASAAVTTATGGVSQEHDIVLRRRWSRSAVSSALVQAGLWMHEAQQCKPTAGELERHGGDDHSGDVGCDEWVGGSSLPSELSLLAPGVGCHDALRRTMRLVEQAVAARDSGDRGFRLEVCAAPRTGYDAIERMKWKARRRQQWLGRPEAGRGGGAAPHGPVKAPQPQGESRLRSGPAQNAKAHRRAVQRLARAAGILAVAASTQPMMSRSDGADIDDSDGGSLHMTVSGTAKAELLLVSPQYWPFVWDGGSVQLAGPALEGALAAVARAVPRARRLALSARRVQLGHRLTLLTLRGGGNGGAAAAGTGAAGQQGATQLLASAAATLTSTLSNLQVVGDVQRQPCQVISRSDGELLIKPRAAKDHKGGKPDAAVCGAMCVDVETVLYSVAVRWPEAAAWRTEMRGLRVDDGSDGGLDTFTVELGI